MAKNTTTVSIEVPVMLLDRVVRALGLPDTSVTDAPQHKSRQAALNAWMKSVAERAEADDVVFQQMMRKLDAMNDNFRQAVLESPGEGRANALPHECLVAVAHYRPQTYADVCDLPGFGPARALNFSESILKITSKVERVKR